VTTEPETAPDLTPGSNGNSVSGDSVSGDALRTPDGAEAPVVAEPASDPAPPAPAAPAATQASPPSEVVPLRAAGRYTGRFVLIYGVLATVLIVAVGGLVVLISDSGVLKNHSSGSWSTWKPASGTTAKVTDEIASHVAQDYHLNKAGAQLVAVVAGPPDLQNGTHKIGISHIAVRKKANSNVNIEVDATGATWTDQLCGLGTSCSIASGQATDTRGRLVRREALEVALYTFKFEPAIKSVVAFMPPPPGQTASTLLYLQKANLTQQLSQPLRKTLPLAKPPLPTVTDATEAATIDKLTLPSTYSYTVQGLQDNSALLILNPIQS
jgi:hypothetical protein